MQTAINAFAALANAAAALLWLRSARVEIRDNVDKFIADLQQGARWSARAALAACAGAAASAVAFGMALV